MRSSTGLRHPGPRVRVARGLDPAGAPIIRALLEAGQYDLLHALVRRDYMFQPFADARAFDPMLSELSALETLLIELFALGRNVHDKELASVLDSETTEVLLECGLLDKSDSQLQSRYLLIPYFNRYFLASPPPTHRRFDAGSCSVYLGPESFWLGKLLMNRGPYQHALDLCAGTGFLSSLVSTERITCVEIDQETTLVARFNAHLNLMRNVSVLQGDLYKPVSDEVFDLVVSNPPFLPAPPGMHLPLCGDGGPTGDTVVKQVLQGLGDHLAEYGQAFVYGEGFGSPGEPFIASWLRDETPSDTFDFTLYVNSTQGPDTIAWRLTSVWQAAGAVVEEAWASWQLLSERVRPGYYHSFLIRAAPGSGNVRVKKISDVPGARL